ncbi:MAG: TetR family transcriptional regulator [Candidatus Dormibacteria bacterium]
MSDVVVPSAQASGGERLTKGQRTQRRILDAALELFQEHGYEGTTMRLIAARAGVSLGNSYQYFPSKDHLVQAFYRRLSEEHIALCRPVLDSERDLRTRLHEVTRRRLESIEPYHRLSGALFRVAADPASPINPFSDDSRPLRQESVALMAEVVSGSAQRLPRDVAAELPRLLWLFHMGLILFWVHDTSPQRRRTRRLAEDSVDLVMSLLSMATLPLMRRHRRRVLALIATVAAADG